ncbi:MAG: hypothetical protein AVDCRST_MAG93-4980 [uncultured Chloroflexia bacterium]|uniref:Uncharacterized protein n=1 Tax=uncultured Chloroflexia bacterium TaxID=1672391 RepID=A0A6J4KIH3_9CHLR|nr:MAG: hypothetical protein AVDCRST_MAG93-4980 [uncultured Chloroflexia bacterium]
MSATPCDRLATVHYNARYDVCDEHAAAMHAGEGEDMADEVVFTSSCGCGLYA